MCTFQGNIVAIAHALSNIGTDLVGKQISQGSCTHSCYQPQDFWFPGFMGKYATCGWTVGLWWYWELNLGAFSPEVYTLTFTTINFNRNNSNCGINIIINKSTRSVDSQKLFLKFYCFLDSFRGVSPIITKTICCINIKFGINSKLNKSTRRMEF